MSSKNFLTLYYAEDKDIYDLLTSSKRKMTIQRLQHVARSRGVCLSEHDSREELAQQIALLGFNKPQMDALLEWIEIKEHDHKTTSVDITASAKMDDLVKIVQEMKEKHAPRQLLQITRINSGRLVVNVQYTEIDTSKTRLAQHRLCDVDIEIENTADGYRLRHKSNVKASQLVDELAQKLAGSEKKSITLSLLASAKSRIDFFIALMNSVPDYDLIDVTVVHCNKMPESDTSSETDIDDDDPHDPGSTLSGALAGRVRKLALTGEALLTSEEYQSAIGKGLFINRAIWRLKKKSTNKRGHEIDLEAEFAESDTEPDGEFRYNVRAFYEVDSEDGKIRKAKQSMLAIEKPALLRLLEQGARTSLTQVTAGTPPPVATPPSGKPTKATKPPRSGKPSKAGPVGPTDAATKPTPAPAGSSDSDGAAAKPTPPAAASSGADGAAAKSTPAPAASSGADGAAKPTPPPSASSGADGAAAKPTPAPAASSGADGAAKPTPPPAASSGADGAAAKPTPAPAASSGSDGAAAKSPPPAAPASVVPKAVSSDDILEGDSKPAPETSTTGTG